MGSQSQGNSSFGGCLYKQGTFGKKSLSEVRQERVKGRRRTKRLEGDVEERKFSGAHQPTTALLLAGQEKGKEPEWCSKAQQRGVLKEGRRTGKVCIPLEHW